MTGDQQALIAALERQERELVFRRFDNGDAWALGRAMVAAATERSLPVTIDIRRHGNQLFHAALAGATPDNDAWIERKVNVVNRFSASSYLVGRRLAATDTPLDQALGVDPARFAAHGGAFPIRVTDVGVVGTATVSGLPQAEDHAFVTEMIAAFLTAEAEETPTIYEWGGGREPFERWLNHFYDLIEAEAPDIAALFGGVVSPQHRLHVTDWWTEVMGGPAIYTEQRGAYEHMLAMHRDLAITPEQRLQFVTLLSRAADDVGLPGDPEFRAALLGYAEWGSRLAEHNSQRGAEVAEHAPVPRWGWGVAPPYQP